MLRRLGFRIIVISLLGFILWPFASVASEATPSGYQVIQPDASADQNALQSAALNAAKQVTVVEFFSYGCPVCARFEPSLEAWMVSKPSYVVFKRIPVVFEAGWMQFAAAYYTAERLHIAAKMSSAIFKAIWTDHEDLSDRGVLQALFVHSGGVTPEQFNDAYDFAPQMAAQLLRSQAIMGAYKIDEVPTLLVDGKYKTNMAIAGSAEKTIEVLKQLTATIAKEKGLTA